MRPPRTAFAFLLLLAGCAEHSPTDSQSASALPPRFQSYFEDDCDYTGNLGIGFVPTHTYDYRFRQQLKTTQDTELKRLFVIEHLYRDIGFALDDFERGRIQIGQASYRPLTLSEWQSTRQSIQTQIDDLAAYSAFTNFVAAARDPMDPRDPSLDKMWIDELRDRLRAVTNAPAANNAL